MYLYVITAFNMLKYRYDNIITETPDFDYASPILDFSIFRGQNRHFCPRLVSFEHQTKA